MFYGHNRNAHPFYVKLNWNPPVQKSVALESYLEEVKLQLTEIQITKAKTKLVTRRTKSTKRIETKQRCQPEKADKGSITVVVNKTDKMKEGESLLN